MSYYDRSRHNPRYQPTRRLTHSQIRRVESTLKELEAEAARWKEIAQKWEAVAKEEHQRASQLEKQLQERGNISLQSRGRPGEAQAVDITTTEDHDLLGEDDEQNLLLEEQLARAQADYENAKKRLEKRFAHQFEQDMLAFLRDLLPVLDNLERAIQHNPADTDAEGVKMTRQVFLSTLDKYGVKPTEVLGEPFDPELQEALGIVEDAEFPPGSVAAVEQPGYTYRDKLLRPARVLVTPEE
jgi:molecular chaperone GrpE